MKTPALLRALFKVDGLHHLRLHHLLEHDSFVFHIDVDDVLRTEAAGQDFHRQRVFDLLLDHLAAAQGFQAGKRGPYPGWKSNPDLDLLALARQVHVRECGGLGAHAPGEAMKIQSVDQCWSLLKALLHELDRP